MAAESQLARLKQGVEAGTAWRKQNRAAQRDLPTAHRSALHACYSRFVMKVAGLAAVELKPKGWKVRPTVVTSSRMPRRCGLPAPVRGLGVNRMFP